MSNYNIDPYFDDFDKTKNYVKVLFKPGLPVQARELTQMQTAIQEQIKSLGSFMFKNESLVLGGESSSFTLNYVDVVAVDLTSYQDLVMVVQNSNCKIKVVSFKNNITSNISRLYFSYLNGRRLAVGDILAEPGIAPTVGTLTVASSSEFGVARAFKLLESVFYVKDYFVVAPTQTVILADSTTPTIKVGLRVSEDIATYQDDESLLDPSSGTYNYAAPGADRVQISLDLVTAAYDPDLESDSENMVESTEDNFIELARYKSGVLIKSLKNPNLGALEDVFARRTYDESGDYTVKPFKARVIDNVKKQSDLLTISVEPGKAYVKGYEFETSSTITVDLDKSRDFETEQNTINEAAYGDYVIVNSNTMTGTMNFLTSQRVTLKYNTNVVGYANVYHVAYESATTLRVYLANITTVNSFWTATYSLDKVNVITDDVWTASVVGTLQRGKVPHLYSVINDTPVKSVYDTSYVSIVKVSGNATSGTEITTSDTLGVGRKYLSSNPNDYIAIHDTNGSRGVITSVGGNPPTSGTFSLTGTFASGVSYSIYAKISVTSQPKLKTRTRATVHVQNTNVQMLGVSDVYRIISITAKNSTGINVNPVDVTNAFQLNNGQKDHIYDIAYISLKPGNAMLPRGSVAYPKWNVLEVVLEYFEPSSDDGYFTVDSYDTTNVNDSLVVPYENIPSFTSSNGKTVSARDIIDFRPRRQKTTGFGSTSLLSPLSQTNSQTVLGGEICQPGSYITMDYDVYLSRIDKLIITKEKRFDLIRGVSARSPGIPADLPDAMTIYNVVVPAYTFSSKDVTLEYIENKRYTMRDIGKIDNRVSKVEYYTAMSLLEKQAADASISTNDGVEKFKNGILVDSFTGHGVGDVGSSDYSCAIDGVAKTLRPRFSKQTVEFDLDRNSTSSSNYSMREEIVTLPYTTEVTVSNQQATNWSDIQRYSTFLWDGELKLFPSSDTWSDQTQLPDVLVNVNGNNDAFTVLADTVANPASTGIKWADWQLVDKGIDVSTAVSSKDNVTYSLTNGSSGRAIETTTTTKTTVVTTKVSDTYNANGLEINRSAVSTFTKDLGSKVVDASLATYIRPRVIDFSAVKMQPNTEVFASFDGVDVTNLCVQAPTIYVQTIPNATKVRKTGTSQTATILSLKTNKAIIKMDPDQYLFSAGDAVDWFIDGNWVTGSSISSVSSPSANVLITDEAGDIGGFFSIPKGQFRTGERAFRLADDLGERSATAAETKYVAMGLAMSLQKDIISTRVQTVSINPTSRKETRVTVNTDTSTQVSAVNKDVTVACGDTASGAGKVGRFTYEIDFGTDIGQCGVNYDATGIPDRYTIIWNGNTYTSGFRGDAAYDPQLNRLGHPSVDNSINTNNPATGKLRFEKTSIFPNKAQLIVDAPITGTAWAWKIVCPGKQDNLIPETSPSLRVSVDTPGNVTLSWAGRFIAGSGQTEFTSAPTSVSYNFTIRIDGNQTVPAGTEVVLNSLQAGESSNGVFASFDSGTGFTRNGVGVVLPLSLRVGETYTFSLVKTLTNSARTATTTNYGSVQPPRINVYATAALVTPIEGTYAQASGSDSTVISSTSQLERWDYANCRHDPLAQTFFVSSRENPDGIFIDSIDIYFKEKNEDEDAPVSVEIRPTVNGYPSSNEVLPLATATKYSRDIVTSTPETASKVATNFTFEAPIFLTPDTEYAVVVGSPVTGFQVYISRIGEFLLSNSNVRATKQALNGSMFYSSNGTVWSAEQTDDLCMRIRKCVFPTGTTKVVNLKSKLSYDQIRSGSIDYDLVFIDGEVLDFASTNVDYYFRGSTYSGTTYTTDNSWSSYQLGSNVPLKSRRSVNVNNPSSFAMRLMMTTTNRDVSPVIDLSRLSGALVQNIINNNSNGETEVSAAPATIYSIAATTTTITITTTTPHGFSAGDFVTISADTNNAVNGYRKILTVGSTTMTFAWTGAGFSTELQGGTVRRGSQSLSSYLTRKVTLNSEFYSDDLRVYYYANIPTECTVIPYYRVTTLNDSRIEDNDWLPMTLESTGTATSSGYVEYKYKPSYTDGNNETVALPSGEQFGTFAVKLVMLSSNTTKIPTIKDLRVIALSN